MTIKEVIKDVLYISDEGNIYSDIDGNYQLKPCLLGANRFGINLKINGKLNHYVIKKMVAEAFVANPQKKKFIKNIDGDITNNKVSNLEWVNLNSLYRNRCDICGGAITNIHGEIRSVCSRCVKENNKKQAKFRKRKFIDNQLNRIDLSKLKDRQREYIILRSQYRSIAEIARIYDVSRQLVSATIKNCCLGVKINLFESNTEIYQAEFAKIIDRLEDQINSIKIPIFKMSNEDVETACEINKIVLNGIKDIREKLMLPGA